VIAPEGTSASPAWRTRLDNLELGLLLFTQPWLAGDGLRRADLERQVGRLGADLPLGPVYFQRIKRAVARLEEIGALRGIGEGRARRFVMTPEGFAAFLLNLSELYEDPTLDGSEFELKRALVAIWSLILERLELGSAQPGADGSASAAGFDSAQPAVCREGEASTAPGVEDFFAAVEALSIDGTQVVSDELLDRALDVLRLIATQKARVEELLARVRGRLRAAETRGLSEVEARRPSAADPRWLNGAEATEVEARPAGEDFDPSHLAREGFPEAASLLAGAPGAAAIVREMSSGVLPALSARSALLRYEVYLQYLDRLARLHAGTLRTVPLAALRQILGAPGAGRS
jgi:hypothetical protein